MKKIKAFTLIELLIVIAIIGILAVAFVPTLLGAPAKARDTKRITDVKKIAGMVTALNASGKINWNNFNSTIHCLDPNYAGYFGVGSFAKFLNQNYLPDFGGIFPKDPDKNNPATPGTPPYDPSCKGAYYMIYCQGLPPSYKLYPFVFANVEDSKKGNINYPWVCSPTLSSSGGGDFYAVTTQ